MKRMHIKKEYFLYGILFSLSNRIQTLGDDFFFDLTIKQHFLMISLQMFDRPPNLRETADLIGCSYQNIKTMANSLEKKGFLRIEKDPEDKRKLLLVSTGKMEEGIEGQGELVESFMKKMYRNIPEADIQVTMKTLLRMDKNLGGIVE